MLINVKLSFKNMFVGYKELCVCIFIILRLCGYPPFISRSEQPMSAGMRDKISKGKYSFPPGEWSNVSREGNFCFT